MASTDRNADLSTRPSRMMSDAVPMFDLEELATSSSNESEGRSRVHAMLHSHSTRERTLSQSSSGSADRVGVSPIPLLNLDRRQSVHGSIATPEQSTYGQRSKSSLSQLTSPARGMSRAPSLGSGSPVQHPGSVARRMSASGFGKQFSPRIQRQIANFVGSDSVAEESHMEGVTERTSSRVHSVEEETNEESGVEPLVDVVAEELENGVQVEMALQPLLNTSDGLSSMLDNLSMKTVRLQFDQEELERSFQANLPELTAHYLPFLLLFLFVFANAEQMTLFAEHFSGQSWMSMPGIAYLVFIGVVYSLAVSLLGVRTRQASHSVHGQTRAVLLIIAAGSLVLQMIFVQRLYIATQVAVAAASFTLTGFASYSSLYLAVAYVLLPVLVFAMGFVVDPVATEAVMSSRAFWLSFALLANIVLMLYLSMRLVESDAREQFLFDYFRLLYLEEVEAQRAINDRYLGNILPSAIIAKLEADPSLIAEPHDDVSVMFCRFQGLDMPKDREEVADLLRTFAKILKVTDELTDAHEAEKIKTIGSNTVMIVAGVPEQREKHARVLVDLALDLRDALNTLYEQGRIRRVHCQIGINSGSLVAGVLSTRAGLSFDVFGDCVNTAARMQSHGAIDRIHVSSSTYLHVKDDFPFVVREPMDIKGKGVMQTYFVDTEQLERKQPTTSTATRATDASADSSKGGVRASLMSRAHSLRTVKASRAKRMAKGMAEEEERESKVVEKPQRARRRSSASGSQSSDYSSPRRFRMESLMEIPETGLGEEEDVETGEAGEAAVLQKSGSSTGSDGLEMRWEDVRPSEDNEEMEEGDGFDVMFSNPELWRTRVRAARLPSQGSLGRMEIPAGQTRVQRTLKFSGLTYEREAFRTTRRLRSSTIDSGSSRGTEDTGTVEGGEWDGQGATSSDVRALVSPKRTRLERRGRAMSEASGSPPKRRHVGATVAPIVGDVRQESEVERGDRGGDDGTLDAVLVGSLRPEAARANAPRRNSHINMSETLKRGSLSQIAGRKGSTNSDKGGEGNVAPGANHEALMRRASTRNIMARTAGKKERKVNKHLQSMLNQGTQGVGEEGRVAMGLITLWFESDELESKYREMRVEQEARETVVLARAVLLLMVSIGVIEVAMVAMVEDLQGITGTTVGLVLRVVLLMVACVYMLAGSQQERRDRSRMTNPFRVATQGTEWTRRVCSQWSRVGLLVAVLALQAAQVWLYEEELYLSSLCLPILVAFMFSGVEFVTTMSLMTAGVVFMVVLMSVQEYSNLGWVEALVSYMGVCTGGAFALYHWETSLRVTFLTGLSLEKDKRDLVREQQRTDALLSSIMPSLMLKQMRSSSESAAISTFSVYFPDACILVADLVGFTPLCNRLSAVEVVEILNDVFGLYDKVAHKHGVQKIKTLGDAVVIASSPYLGVKGNPAHALARTALDLVRVTKEYQGRDGVELKVRVGIDCGPVVAGILGKTKVSWDLYGQAVDTATAMESSSETGRIHVTEAFAKLVDEVYVVEKRGRVALDVHGETRVMESWFLGEKRRTAW